MGMEAHATSLRSSQSPSLFCAEYFSWELVVGSGKEVTSAKFGLPQSDWRIFTGGSRVSIQLSTEEVYQHFPGRSVPADVHGILLRVAALEDTLADKMMAWRDLARRQSKRIKDFADIARLVEAHPELWERLPDELKEQIERPPE